MLWRLITPFVPSSFKCFVSKALLLFYLLGLELIQSFK